MRIGIDFGTTHTGAAVMVDGKIQFIPLDPYNTTDPHLLRSMIYVKRSQEHLVGRAAVETYLVEDTGRFVRYEDKVVGTVENTVARLSRGPTDPDGPIQIIYDVVVAEDVGSNGRLIQSIKTGLRDESYAGTNIYGQFYSIQELIALLLTQVREQAEHFLGQPVTSAVLGRPVRFSDEPNIDEIAEQRLREAANMAGFTEIELEKEPIAAARFYTNENQRAETILVFDFGGGTLDLTIMRTAIGQSPQILATHGVLVGGDDIDSAMMRNRVSRQFGTESKISPEGAPFPYELANLLERWQTIPVLSRPLNLKVISDAKERGDNPDAFAALETLVLKNYGFALFSKIEQLKRALSVDDCASMQMQIDNIDVALTIDRAEFPRIINREIAMVQRGISQVMEKAGISDEQIDVVVTTGGSSLIPIFRTILSRKFSQARIVRSNTFGSVTAGLAIQAADS
ncbi:MAG: Hsp70 family protein [Anaerolineales bacterium]|nr:Hsp70 family protein [Anaerolineales bacterium]